MLTFISVRLIKKSQVGICRLNTFFTPPIVISISNISYFVESADKEQSHNCNIRNSLLVMALKQFCKIRTRKKTDKNQ